MNKIINNSKFIIIYHKEEIHKGNLKNFDKKINNEITKKAELIQKANNQIVKYNQIIIEAEDYFNIYLDFNSYNIDKKIIEQMILKIDNIIYTPYDVLAYNHKDKQLFIYLALQYLDISPLLLLIIIILHKTNSINKEEIKKTLLEIKKMDNLVIQTKIIDTVLYFNKIK